MEYTFEELVKIYDHAVEVAKEKLPPVDTYPNDKILMPGISYRDDLIKLLSLKAGDASNMELNFQKIEFGKETMNGEIVWVKI